MYAYNGITLDYHVNLFPKQFNIFAEHKNLDMYGQLSQINFTVPTAPIEVLRPIS